MLNGKVPSYLKGYEDIYFKDKRKAGLEWFKNAKFGLFIHYGLYSQLKQGEWIMYKDKIPVKEYEKLKDSFTAKKFDAEYIADLAVAAGMKYINLVTRHHDSFSLFETNESDFNSMNAPCNRDFVAEMANACEKRGLGLFLYYSYGADWRHPYFVSNESGIFCARPHYDKPDPSYLLKDEKEFKYYIEFMHNQLTELLTNYGSVAGVWFDLISACYYRPDLFPIEETYSLIRKLQPQCLISFKQGINGDEDFMSQEREFVPLRYRLEKSNASKEAIELSDKVWDMNINKWNEVTTILQDKGWSYVENTGHRNADEVMRMLANTAANRCNLLLNTGPLPDGSIHKDDVATLLEVGRRIKENGFPKPEDDKGPVIPPSYLVGAEAE